MNSRPHARSITNFLKLFFLLEIIYHTLFVYSADSEPVDSSIATSEKVLTLYPETMGRLPQVGDGWSSEARSFTSSNCLNGSHKVFNLGEKTVKVSERSSIESAMDTTNLSVDARFDSIGGNVSAKAAFLKESSKSTSLVNLFMYARYIEAADEIVAENDGYVHLKSNFARTLNDTRNASDNLIKFRQSCGDWYVYSIYYGGEVIGSFNSNTINQADTTTFSADLRAMLNTLTASASIDVAMKTEAFTKASAETYSLEGKELKRNGQISTTYEGILQSIKKLPEGMSDQINNGQNTAVPLAYIMARYEGLKEFPSQEVGAIPEPGWHKIARLYWRYVSINEEVERVLNHKAGFIFDRGVNIASLRKVQDSARSAYFELSKLAAECLKYKYEATHCDSTRLHLTSEYDLLSRFPAPWLSFSADKERDWHETSELANFQQQRAFWTDSSRAATQDAQRNGVDALKAINETERRIIDLENSIDYKNQLRQSVIDTWIRPLLNERCQISEEIVEDWSSTECISSERLEEYQQKIEVDDIK